ncbi:MAG: hypothetical protein AB7T07_12540 [Steroidobacteraceae bacterium]
MNLGIQEIDISSTVTRLRCLSLRLPERSQHLGAPVNFSRLMDLSVERIENMAHSHEPDQQLVASRIFENASSYCRWESEHSLIMRRVAQQRRSHMQSYELLAATFALIHRKSLFAHLRQHQVYGQRREQLMRHFFACHSYARGMIAEHGIFLRSSASLVCSSYLGINLLHDAVFQEPLQEYEQLYAAYFDAHCEVLLAPVEEEVDSSHMAQSLVYSLKCDLGILRRTIFGLASKLPAFDARH